MIPSPCPLILALSKGLLGWSSAVAPEAALRAAQEASAQDRALLPSLSLTRWGKFAQGAR